MWRKVSAKRKMEIATANAPKEKRTTPSVLKAVTKKELTLSLIYCFGIVTNLNDLKNIT